MKKFLSHKLLETECLGKYQICTCFFICLFSFTLPLTSVCYCPFSVICYWPGECLTGASTFALRAVHQEFSYSPWLTLLHLVQNTKCAGNLTEDVTPRLRARERERESNRVNSIWYSLLFDFPLLCIRLWVEGSWVDFSYVSEVSIHCHKSTVLSAGYYCLYHGCRPG